MARPPSSLAVLHAVLCLSLSLSVIDGMALSGWRAGDGAHSSNQ